MGIFGGIVVLVLLGLLGALVRSDVAELKLLPVQLLTRGLIGDGDVPAVAAAAQRVSRWRRRGAVLGLIGFAVVSIPAEHRVSVSTLALLAGTVTGMTCAEWWGSRGDAASRRSASLRRRTLVSVVGRRPVVLAVGSAAVFATGVVVTALERPSSASTLTVHPRAGMTCTYQITSGTDFLVSAVLSCVASMLGLAAALAVTRRGVDHTIPEAADAALRGAGVRSALGAVIVVLVVQAAQLLYQLPALVSAPCSSQSRFAGNASAIVHLTGVGGFVVAFAVLVRYVLRPVRWPDATEQVAVA